jgi:hypothetical protein
LFAGEPYGEVIIAANALDQASLIIYDKIKKAILLNPRLRSGAKVGKYGIEIRSTGTTCRPVAHQYTSIAGVNPTLVLFDELWGFPSREFYDELTTSPARKEPLNLIVTYAGYDIDSLLGEVYKAGLANERAATEGLPLPDPDMFFLWLQETRASWVSQKYLDAQRRRLPPNVYARFHENKWTASGTPFITRADVDRCYRIPWVQHFGRTGDSHLYVVATDLGLSHDRTARAVVHFDYGDGRVYLDSLRVWEGTPKHKVSIQAVEQDLIDCATAYRARRLKVDPWQMEATIQKLKRYFDIEPFNFATDMAHMSQLLVTLLKNDGLVLYPEPMLEKELMEALPKDTPKGWKLEHGRRKHNDCIVTLGMAAMEAVRLGVGGGPLPEQMAQPPGRPNPIMSGILAKEF